MTTNNLEIIIKAQDYASKELKKIEKQVKGMQGTFKKTGKSIKDFGTANKETFKKIGIGAGIAITAIGVAGKQFLDLGTQIQQTQKKADIVFGDYVDGVKDIARETAKSMGLSQNEYLNAAAGLQDLLIPMGFARDEASKLTTDTIALSGALSEWSAGQYNATEVAGILAKAYLGETEQLKSMGISINAAEIATRVLDNAQVGIKGSTEAQSKALAIQGLILEKSTDAQEAFKNGGDSLARQQAVLTATIKDARDTIAIALIPTMNTLIQTMAPIIEDLAKSIELWAQNKDNIEGLKTTMINTIEVFKTIGAMIKWIIILLGWLLKPFQEAVDSIALLAADIVIFFGNMTGSLTTFSSDTNKTINDIKGFFSGLFSFLFPQLDFLIKKMDFIKGIGSAIGIGGIDGEKANGGPVTGGKTYLVGERGPELFTPKSSGGITPNNKLGGSANISINMGGVSVNNSADENRLVEKIKSALVTEAKMFNLGIS